MAVHVRAEEFARSHSAGYHRILVPLIAGDDSMRAVGIACRLAAEQQATVAALALVRVPIQLPLGAHMVEDEVRAKQLVAAAAAVGEAYGVSVDRRIARTRAEGEAIVDAAALSEAEVIVLQATDRPRWRRRPLDDTVQFVLKHSPCRVVVDAGPAHS